MKRYIISILLLAFLFGFCVSTARAQEVTIAPTASPTPPSAELNPDVITAGITINLLITLLITLIAGALGGVVYELIILQGNIERPHNPTQEEAGTYPYAVFKFMYDLGIWARIIIGGLAAVAGVFLLAPSSTFSLLAIGVIAGSAGVSIFRSMQDRLLALIAQNNAAQIQNNAAEQDKKVDEALAAFTGLKGALINASSIPVGARALSFGGASGASINLPLDDLDRVEHLLFEAKGVFKRIE
jgi:hypothetical protein